MPKNPNIKKVVVIGSGPIVIGQAAEFDYARYTGLSFIKRRRPLRCPDQLQSGYDHDR